MTPEPAGPEPHLPAWRRRTPGEHRWPMSLVVLVAVALQVVLPEPMTFGSRWLLPAVQATLLIGLMIADPRRIERDSRRLRVAGLTLIALVSTANAWSAARLAAGLVAGTDNLEDLDRGGPVARAEGSRPHPDFLFPQMQNPEMAHPDWEPAFVDYLYLAFTNASAFSPTDVLPLSRWAKLTMMLQAAVSLTTVALVIARAVNTLR
jgi:hypothetical protein